VNFSCYYLLLLRQVRSVFKDEELRLYIGIVVASIAMIAWNIHSLYDTAEEAIRHAAFQVGSIITTTGYATTDFDLWPSFSKAILLGLMIVGACAGSTGGGIKIARVLLLFKSLRRNIRLITRPNTVQVVRSNGNPVEEKVLENTNAYLAAYMIILVLSIIVISLDGLSMTTNITAVLACFNNIGPGLEIVGPTGNFSSFSTLSKLILSVDMLAGRLEIFPILVLLSRRTWNRK
jgi:trk system potassium uptake protein TrkH